MSMDLFDENKKVCSICGIEKMVIHFEPHKSGKSRRPYCYSCKARAYRLNTYRKRGKEAREYISLEDRKNNYLKQIETGLKRCRKCGDVKSLNEFAKETRKKNINGWSDELRRSICKKCSHQYQKLRKQKRPKSEGERKKLNSEEKEIRYQVQLLKARERYWNDPEYREQILQYSKDHHKKDRSKMLARKHKREALEMNQHDGTVTPKEINYVLNKSKTCPYCGKPIGKPELDHMDPLSKGGLHSISNIIGCCHRCNSLKHMKSFIEWLPFIPDERRDYVIRLYEKKHEARPEQRSLPFKYAA